MDFETLKQSSSNFDKLTKAIEANLNPEDKQNNKSKYQGLEIFTLIPALIIVLVFPLIQPDHQTIQYYSISASIHIIIAMLGYGLLAFGSIFSLFLLLFEKSLHAETKSPSMICLLYTSDAADE